MFDLKTAVGFFGIHYVENLNHWMGWNTMVDYSKCLNNNNEYVFKHFKHLDYYSSTYFSPKVEDLVSRFNFNSIQLNKLVNQRDKSSISRNKRFIEVIKLIIDSGENYDSVILMRYDLYFLQSIKDLEINRDLVNVVCKNKSGDVKDLADDNFYVIPFKKLKQFYDCIVSIPLSVSSHEYNKYVDMHYMINESYYTHEYPTFTIHRSPVSLYL